MRCLFGLLAVTACLTACGPEPTPFPVDIPATPTTAPLVTFTPVAAPVALPDGVIRYALAANTTGFVTDLALLEQSAHVETLTTPVDPADLGRRYDLIAAYGDLPGGIRSPVEQHIVLLINPALAPTDDPAVVNVLRQAVQPRTLLLALNLPGTASAPSDPVPQSVLRAALANAGWPDGFDLKLLHDGTPGAAQLGTLLQTLSIDVHRERTTDAAAALETGRAHLALISLPNDDDRADWETRIGAANVMPLYTLPISYLAVEGLTISFTPTGWPLARR